tara:strand:- start:7568 stop:9547 length:1980 start_codon:yes stop_codon:yes gene_type:complete
MGYTFIKNFSAFSAQAQRKSNVADDSFVLDESLENIKKPNSDLDVTQKIAKAGETVPIVFGKRANNIGGVWLQPSIIKAGTQSFVQKLLFVISQGEIISTPDKAKAFTGLNKITFTSDASNISLTHIYNSASTLAANPNSCPINSAGLYCGNDIYSYLSELQKPSGDQFQKSPDYEHDFYAFRQKTFGTGDTSNIVFYVTQQVFDAETGANVSNAWSTYSGYPVNQQYSVNQSYNSSTGRYQGTAVGTITNFLNSNNTLFPPLSGSQLASLKQVSGGRTKFVFKYTFVSLNTQRDTQLPASTGTLEGVQDEFIIGTSATIQNTSNNNSSFADITFLASSGNLYETPASGTFPTTTKQVYIFYEEGVKVDLYSAGLSGSSYTQGASNQFIDLAMHLFKLYKKIDGNNTATIVAPVKLSNLQALSTFCTNNSFFFNGVISKAVNIVEFISKISPYFFLSFLSVGGKYEFAPILPINNSNQFDTGAISPVMTFTEANIIQESFSKQYLSVEEKRNFVANCIYTNCIPSEVARRKTVSVKFTTTDLDAPTEQFDMSDFCTDANHAIQYAKYELSKRKHSTHTISFSTPLITTSLIPTNIIKLQIVRNNSVGDNRTEIEYYQISSITYDTNGISNIEASHFPLNNSNVSQITNELLTGSYTVLQ